MPTPSVDDEDLRLDLEAYHRAGGNRSEGARLRGLKRQTYNDRLRMAEKRFGIVLGKVAGGRIKAGSAEVRKPPRRGRVKRYILSSAQNNTHLHPGFHNLLAYRDWLDALPNGSCELLVGTYTYQMAAYGPKAVKRGTYDRKRVMEKLWYDPEVEPYIVDRSVQLAPGLVWCGEMNILPTNRHPLTGFEDYNGRQSNVVPHAKIAMESVASMADEPTKFNYSTGTVTQRNYLQKRAGILAEREHSYGALLVEVDDQGSWWARQLHIAPDDSLMDVGPDGCPGVRVQAGQVSVQPVTEGIAWGDVHVAEQELWVRRLAWGPNGMLDTLQPGIQFVHDVFSMRSRGHHEDRDFHRTFQKHVDGDDDVEGEVRITAEFLAEASRPWTKTVVVPSNHDRHLDRWLNEADFRKDPLNARYFCELQLALLRAMEAGDRGFNVLEWALRQAGCPEDVQFLSMDESYVVGDVEYALHGDLGPNGSRGSTRSLTKLGRGLTKGHDHTAAIRGNVYSVGACSLSFPYMKGPNSHSVSHVVQYLNGARTVVTMWAGKWRA